tara:strand:- start:40743 stop:41141 length:399 start_codon:yes stop_codon:yes gene_type:complete
MAAGTFNFTSLINGLTENVSGHVQKVAVNIHKGAIEHSRLDTGKTKNNWEATVDTISTADRDAIETGNRKTYARLSANTNAARQRGASNISKFSLARNNEFIAIVNNTDYFPPWNEQDSTAILAIREALAAT